MNFRPPVIAPYIETIITELVRLTAEAEELETKHRILESFNDVIENIGAMVNFTQRINEPVDHYLLDRFLPIWASLIPWYHDYVSHDVHTVS